MKTHTVTLKDFKNYEVKETIVSSTRMIGLATKSIVMTTNPIDKQVCFIVFVNRKIVAESNSLELAIEQYNKDEYSY